MNPNIANIGNRFTSENQPDPIKKRVPKYKTKLKRFIIENIDVIAEQMKKGNYKFWEIAFERGYGKEKMSLDIKNTDNLTEKEIDDLIEAKLKLLNGNTTE